MGGELDISNIWLRFMVFLIIFNIDVIAMGRR